MKETKFLDWAEFWDDVNAYGRAYPWLSRNLAECPDYPKLNLGCGSLVYNPDHGWSNMDIQPGPGIIQHNMYDFPWPFPDDTFEYVHMANILEHVCQNRWFDVMNELFRITRPDGHWEILGPDPANTEITLQAPSHSSLVGPWTFNGWINRVDQGALDIAYSTERNRLIPVDMEYSKDRPIRWTRWYGFHLGNLSDWHLRRYFGRRIGDVLARILGRPWTLRLVYRVVKSRT